jgi:hypothetical protein
MPVAWTGARVVTLPGGARVRGRRLADLGVAPADWALLLGTGPAPPWPAERIRWPDFWLPLDREAAVAALRRAHQRAYAGATVEIACRGGIGRTGTALAALAVFDGLTPTEAVAWVREAYHPRAVETPWQRWWLRHIH